MNIGSEGPNWCPTALMEKLKCYSLISYLCLPENYDGWPVWLWQLQGVPVWPQVHPVRWQPLLHPMLRQPVLQHLWWVQRANRPWCKGEVPITTQSDMQSALWGLVFMHTVHKFPICFRHMTRLLLKQILTLNIGEPEVISWCIQ